MTHEFFEGEKPLNIVLSGQKLFGLEVLKLCERERLNIQAVCVPITDKYLLPYAREAGYKIIPGGSLTADVMPDNCDLGICAHSFDYVGKLTRYRAKLGWIGYHPSLLPRHRGRSSIEWALRMKDVITGGTVFWLNAGIDRGDIAYQDWIWLDHSKDARYVWREELMPMGLRLINTALRDIKNATIIRKPQRDLCRFSTFEPGLENIRDIYKPDLLMLHGGNLNNLN